MDAARYSSQDAQTILRTRAQNLARAPEQDSELGATLELLEFRLALERYGVETRHVQEVQPLRDLTPLPCTPSYMRGIVNVRGQILPVVDIKEFFDLPREGITDLHRIVIIRGQGLEIGLLVDVVVGVRSISTDGLQSLLPTFAGIRAEYLKGVAAGRLIVLDMDHILSDPKLIVNEEVED